jgi:DNA-binding MarR family transcriptional regulator
VLPFLDGQWSGRRRWYGRAVPDTVPRVSYVVARLDRALRREIDERVRPHGLTATTYTALSVLATGTGLSNAQLARRSYITPQSMNQLVAALEREGLIERIPDPAHRRILRARLTRKGRRVLAVCDAAVDEMEEQMLRDLPKRERERLRRQLIGCVRGLGAGLKAT